MATAPSTGTGTSGGFQWWNPLDWFTGIENAGKSWLGGIGGDIASGIEAGVISSIKDLLGPIVPWLEIIAGALIFFWVLSFYFATSPAGTSLLKFAVAEGFRG